MGKGFAWMLHFSIPTQKRKHTTANNIKLFSFECFQNMDQIIEKTLIPDWPC